MISEYCICSTHDKPVRLTLWHALSCKKFGGLIHRHELVKDVWIDLLKAGRQPFEVEPKQTFPTNKLRPDLLVRFALNGQDAAYDITIYSPVRDANAISSTIKDEQRFLMTADQIKRDKYQEACEQCNTLFYPIVLSAFGGMLEESYQFGFKELIFKTKRNSFVPPNWAARDRESFWSQRVGVSLWIGNASKISPFLKKNAAANW